jgi:hypothetical protein
MSKAAADAFALAAKATRGEFQAKCSADFTKFVDKKQAKPTTADVEALRQHLMKYEEICKYMRRKVAEGMPETWGGSGDTDFRKEWTLLETLKRLAR